MDWWVKVKGVQTRRHASVWEVKHAVPITTVLQYYGLEKPPHQSGWTAVRCPFHDDKRASASVNDRLGRFRCHGPCDYSGDVIDLVSWREGLTTREALRWIEERFL